MAVLNYFKILVRKSSSIFLPDTLFTIFINSSLLQHAPNGEASCTIQICLIDRMDENGEKILADDPNSCVSV
jgi:hypothetical protein